MTLSYRFDSVILTRRFLDPQDWVNSEVNTLQTPTLSLQTPDGHDAFTLQDNGHADPNQFTDSMISYTLDTLGAVTDTLGMWNIVGVRRVTYNDGSFTDLLTINRHVFEGEGDNRVMVGFDEIFIYLDGVALPDFSSVADCVAWANNFESWGPPDPATYPPGTLIDWGDFDINNVIRGSSRADTLVGSEYNDQILGLAGNDSLSGLEGNDTLNGAAGRDTMNGGNGDDVLAAGAMDTAADQLNGGAGSDTADYSAVTADSGITVNLLTGSARNPTYIGLDILDSIENVIGGAGADTIIGTDDANRIDGGGGADVMRGGTGDDIYVVDNLDDLITEGATGGSETVISQISGYVLGLNLECLQLDGMVRAGTGNALANLITGNAAVNVLSGDLGADTLLGMAGADTLQGGAGNDSLDGGLGADRMLGGAGNDVYLVDDLGDRIYETVTLTGTADAGGRDTVVSSVSINLNGYVGARFVEVVTLTGYTEINATGNALNNVITGNDATNILAGGLGNDVITTGWGNDVIVFNTAIGAGNVDQVTDFYTGYDTFRLDDAIFTALTRGDLAASAFVANEGGRAMDADDRILFDTATTRLYYDADGNGAGARVLIAYVAGSILTADDFTVI
ncbi:Ca2+-binding RTX toxin-like protein [Rhodobacter viridis]|uniref:Ca2+-binding RTX toxin-like protein n=1 Tax=Rhodobacter viridis TaxID=1054202 RepID=A0A318U322_9RHOB|nr:calcium-binding protein [Rhodobacter viridis]PYF09763.1 Ca2+-binding RTX toxin-like protein [Rhodobacter viridis]